MSRRDTHCGTTLYMADRPRSLSRTALRREIGRLIRKWAPRLALDQWGITVEYDDDQDVEGTCESRPRYEEATLTFNIWLIQQVSGRTYELEELVVHELVHCIAWPASEVVVSRVARALLRTERLTKKANRK